MDMIYPNWSVRVLFDLTCHQQPPKSTTETHHHRPRTHAKMNTPSLLPNVRYSPVTIHQSTTYTHFATTGTLHSKPADDSHQVLTSTTHATRTHTQVAEFFPFPLDFTRKSCTTTFWFDFFYFAQTPCLFATHYILMPTPGLGRYIFSFLLYKIQFNIVKHFIFP